MKVAALSLEQAPPISVPLRFFLSVPVFGVLAGGLLAWVGADALASRWTPAMLAVAHLLGLGVLGMAMIGALFQLLPVLAGVPVARARGLAGAVHVAWLIGAIALPLGLWDGSAAWIRLALVALALAGGGVLAVIGRGLWLARSQHASVRGLRLALLGLAATLALGLVLAAGHGFRQLPLPRVPWTDVHVAFAWLGWVASLIAAVALQVVPMFQMTPEYPPALQRWLAGVVLAALALAAALAPLTTRWIWALAPAVLALSLFAATTLRLLARRRRKRGDASLIFWRLGMASGLAAAAAWLALPWLPPAAGGDPALWPGLLFFAGFSISVLCAMLYKIVPFLVFLHLQQRIGASPALRQREFPPSMNAVLSPAAASAHLYLHALALAIFAIALLVPGPWLRLAGLTWATAFATLGWNLGQALRRYRAQQQRLDGLEASSGDA